MSDALIRAHMTSSFDRSTRVSRLIVRLAETYGLNSEEFLRDAVSLILSAQETQALASWVYLVEEVARLDPLGRVLNVDPPVEKLIGAATHNGTPLETVYRRFGPMVEDLVVSGLDRPDALAQTLRELEVTASSDVATAGRKAEQAYGAADERVTGWRRVPNVGACKWCRYIATQRYNRDDLAPAHRDCNCGTRPIVGPSRQIVDPEALAQIKREGVPARRGQRQRDATKASRFLDEDDG